MTSCENTPPILEQIKSSLDERSSLRIALVQPAFPWPSKSKNSHQSIPYGLLKIGNLLKTMGVDARLYTNGMVPDDFIPDEVWITTLFTYWADYVQDSYEAYKQRVPDAVFRVGGILTTLAPDFCGELFGTDSVYEGLFAPAEGYPADYDMLGRTGHDELDLQVLVASRGCIRRCSFCYTWKLEGDIQGIPVEQVISQIHKKRVVFYDNNFLANPLIEELLEHLRDVRIDGTRPKYECQSGFDGRILQLHPELARSLKLAGFAHPRIAWDGPFNQKEDIRSQIDVLIDAGFRRNDIQVFMLFNHDLPPEHLDMKRRFLWNLQVQIIDCRFRPLDQFHDHFSAKKEQDSTDYYIHPLWTDSDIKKFRKAIRSQNICVRFKFPFHSKYWERRSLREQLPQGILHQMKHAPSDVVKTNPHFVDAFYPEEPLYAQVDPLEEELVETIGHTMLMT